MKQTILIIDDDEKLCRLLSGYFEKFGFQAEAVHDPIKGLAKIRAHEPDLIVLDVMLPEMDGFEACREIRKEFNTPIIMLTARGEVTDRVVGLELGADDYLAKPFEPRELVARIQAILRRNTKPKSHKTAQFGDLTIDFQKQQALLNGEDLEFTSAEFELISLFAKNPGEVLTRDRIMEEVRGIEWESFNRSVDVFVSRVRQKLKDNPKKPAYIKTVWGSGYMFIAAE